MPKTTEKGLPTLLREISEIDDDVVYHRDMGDLSRQILVWAPNFEGRMDFRKPTPGNIQAALQEACKERRWTYEVKQYGDINDDRDDCAVQICPEGKWMHRSDWNASAKNPTDAFALAFLKALKVEHNHT